MAHEPVHLDDHRILIAAPAGRVWRATLDVNDRMLRAGRPITWVLGTDPPAGFEATAEEPFRRLDLSGRHRFATYLLRFELTDSPDTGGSTLLFARSYADFHGWHGRAYRTALLATRGHVTAVQLLLHLIKLSATKR